MTYSIYKHTNKINGKSYIGQTKFNLEIRLKGHLKSVKAGSEYAFHRAIRKYGIENFQSEILEENISDILVEEKEQYWIKKYNSFGEGYNMTSGGEGTKNIIVKESTKEKLRKYAIKAYDPNGNIVSVSKEEFNLNKSFKHINSGRLKTAEQKRNNAKANYIKFKVFNSENILIETSEGDLKEFWEKTKYPQQLLNTNKFDTLYLKTPNNIISRLKKSGNYKFKGWYIERY